MSISKPVSSGNIILKTFESFIAKASEPNFISGTTNPWSANTLPNLSDEPSVCDEINIFLLIIKFYKGKYMSLLKLKSKTEPLYTNKNNINYDDDSNKQINEPINALKENSSLIIGEGATIKGEIVEENEITVQGNVDGDIQCKDLIIGNIFQSVV